MNKEKESLEEILDKLPMSIKTKYDFGLLRISPFYQNGKLWAIEYYFSSTSNRPPIVFWDSSLYDACKKMLEYLEKEKLS
ncbi:MAG: hypothetical protein IMZ58_07555 [Thermoplasmata archaeon]|nr:hypothetical protein [Thermoplasmata archaeon]